LARTEKIAVGGMIQTPGLVLIRVLGASRGPAVAGKTLSTLGRNHINIVCVVSFVDANGRENIAFAIRKEDLDQALGLLQTLKEEIQAEAIEYQSNCCAVAIYGPHFSERPAIAGKMFAATAEAGLEIHMISTSISTVSCVIDEVNMAKAVAKLQETFLVP